MIAPFKKLNPDEIKLMVETPALVTILIAGADENIEKKETDWAAKLTKYRKATAKHPALQDYYAEVDKDFENMLNRLINALPAGAGERNEKISTELSKLNDILPRLSKEFATIFYNDMKSFAEGVAKSAGGVMGVGSIGHEEEKWLHLAMINRPD
ncbi:MAG: hypothetical protein ACE5I1_00845 [bacterium]